MPSTQKRKEEKIDKLGPYKQITFNLTYLPRQKKKKRKKKKKKWGVRMICSGKEQGLLVSVEVFPYFSVGLIVFSL